MVETRTRRSGIATKPTWNPLDDERIYVGGILTLKLEDGESVFAKITKMLEHGIEFDIIEMDS